MSEWNDSYARSRNNGCMISVVSFFAGVVTTIVIAMMVYQEYKVRQSEIEKPQISLSQSVASSYSTDGDNTDQYSKPTSEQSYKYVTLYELLYDQRYGDYNKWVGETVEVEGYIKGYSGNYITGDILALQDDTCKTGYDTGEFIADYISIKISNDEQANILNSYTDGDLIRLVISINWADSVLGYTSNIIDVK